jgi:hypothetical protein
MSPERRQAFVQYLSKKSTMTEESSIRWIVNMRLTDPDVYSVFKLILKSLAHKFENKNAKKFMLYVSDYFLKKV